MSRAGSEARLVVAGVASLVVAGILATGLALGRALENARAPLAAAEARYARLAGLEAVAPRLEVALAELDDALARHAHPAELAADRLGTDLQQRARRIAEGAGLVVTGSQILPLKSGKHFTRIPMAMTVEGSLEGLRDMLLGLREASPSIQVDRLVVQPAIATQPEPGAVDRLLAAQMNLSVLQRQP